MTLTRTAKLSLTRFVAALSISHIWSNLAILAFVAAISRPRTRFMSESKQGFRPHLFFFGNVSRKPESLASLSSGDSAEETPLAGAFARGEISLLSLHVGSSFASLVEVTLAQ